MKQNEIFPAIGSRKKSKRVGRGIGSGHGAYSGKGIKGQKSRAGNAVKPKSGFEGGQLPLILRMPSKKGFRNPFRVEYHVVNLSQLNDMFEKGEVTPEMLVSAKLVKNLAKPIKVLGDGEISKALTVKANKF